MCVGQIANSCGGWVLDRNSSVVSLVGRRLRAATMEEEEGLEGLEVA